MIKNSIIKAKLRRSRVSFKKTVFETEDIEKRNFDDLNLTENEKVIALYELDNYCWVLTNINFFIPTSQVKIKLKDLVKVDFDKVKKNIETKNVNTELTLYAKEKEYNVFFEEGTWHVFYNLFIFIIGKYSRDR